MSHVATVALKVKDLDALKAAARELGLEFRQGQSTYKWYRDQRNACDHAIGIKNNEKAYEVGVIREKDGSYSLAWDPFNGGYGLVDHIGQDANKLKQIYAKQCGLLQARKQNMRVTQRVRADGYIVVEMEG